MVCCLTRIGDDLYADMEPSSPTDDKPTASDVDDMFNGGSYTTIHSMRNLFSGEGNLNFGYSMAILLKNS
jgi:hypothetical protein